MKGHLVAEDFKFVERERKKIQRKEAARARATISLTKKTRARQKASLARASFLRGLKKKYGNVVRAWLCAIDLDSSMAVQQKELFKACGRMGWSGDVRALWNALDVTNSGVTSLEELDAEAAQKLASFKEFCVTRYGSCAEGFLALDRNGIKRLRHVEFVSSLKAL